ncbi:MAG: DUF177 domain-containing protein [Candidatus Tectomicrobia bacterium]|uniref:DUF177 domain-containing protein n=1 Tax=Tectimicrobiota bacterium TaxID=2528274 RepID=A0A933LRH6_UNCTE|nr:DUF177 domain-containing protein [Candidatus Tectomicrobia bacterium]
MELDLSEPGASFYILDTELHVRDTIRVQGEITKIEGNFLLTGTIETTLIFLCDRCLEEYLFPLHLEMHELFLPEKELKESKEESEEDLDLYFINDDRIDLGTTVRDTIILSLPMKRLCSEGCLGLCPHCGTNFNIASCNCSSQEIDPRLEILKNLIVGKE